MKKNILLQSLMALMPAVYLLMIWNRLPELVPLHYNGDFKPDNMGSRTEMLIVLLVMAAANIVTCLVVGNMKRIDPKKNYTEPDSIVTKLTWAITLFLSAIGVIIVYMTSRYANDGSVGASGNLLIAMVCLLFSVLGNFMNNIRPNWFIGIRTPWTMEDDENWRLTHRLASRLWFFGGLMMFTLSLTLPAEYGIYVILGGAAILVGIPAFYSYSIFRKKQNQNP